MLINKIIFFITSPFNQRDYERFGIEVLQTNGFDVEVWDFISFLKPEVYEKVKVPDPINLKKCILFSTIKSAQSAILGLKTNCFIVSLIGYDFKSFLIYRALSKAQIPYSVFMANALPHPTTNKRLFDIFRRLKNATPDKIINSIFIHIPYNWLSIKPAATILAGGAKSKVYNYLIGKETETLWLHTLDYDIYLNENKNGKIDSNQGVFLDEYLPFHPDFVSMGIAAIKPNDYYPQINHLFKILEEKYKVEITIAAHPRSNYKYHPDIFEGRPIIRGKTSELIRKSGFVIAHSSTSINFAVLYHKPIIFITSNELREGFTGPYIDLIANMLGKEPINLDDSIEINWVKELSINDVAYSNYKNSYIKKAESENLQFWQIFADYIKNKYNTQHRLSI